MLKITLCYFVLTLEIFVFKLKSLNTKYHKGFLKGTQRKEQDYSSSVGNPHAIYFVSYLKSGIVCTRTMKHLYRSSFQF